MNLASFTQDGFAFDMNIGMNHAVTSDPCIAANVGMRRIDESHAGVKHQAPNGSSPDQILEFGQLGPGINAGNLARVSVLEQTDALGIAFKDDRYVSQIVFALAVRGQHLVKRWKELIGIETVNARVYFTNLSFVFGRISLLDDFGKAVVGIANYATIPRRVLKPESKNCASGILIPVCVEQSLQCLRAHQRNISRKDQNS